MEAQFESDVESANVFGEIVGRERPNEIVLVGCHFDSWDVGTGASDDGVGCIVTWEALRLMKTLGLQPRRTVRLGLFTNEENGLRGGNAYRDAYKASASNHVFALESDSGVFAPSRLGFTGSAGARAIIDDIGALLRPLGMADIGPGGGGADIGPIAQAGNVPMMAYQGDTHPLLHHPPHPGRHGRSHRAGGSVEGRCGDCRRHLRGGGAGGTAAEMTGTGQGRLRWPAARHSARRSQKWRVTRTETVRGCTRRVPTNTDWKL